MSNQIQTIVAAAAATWSASIAPDTVTGNLVFHVVGGTFSDGNTQKTVSPVDGKYNLSLTGQPPADVGTTQIVSVYYESADGWQISQEASRIIVLPQQREIDFRIQRSGFGVLPKGATLDATYGGLALVGEVKTPTGDSFRTAYTQGNILRLDKIPSGLFDTTKSPFIAHDRANGVVYFLNAANTLKGITVGSTLADDDTDKIVQIFERLNGTAREFVVFYQTGRVEVYDKGMNFLSQADTGIKNTQRVVYRRKNVGTNGANDTYVAFDVLGRAYYLSAAFAQTSMLNDQFYTDASDSYAVLCTRSGRLVGLGVSNAPQGFTFYQFIPGSLIAVGVNTATGSICQFNIRDNALYAPSRTLVQNSCVAYNAPADWTPSGTGFVGGLDSIGSNDLFRFADSASPQTFYAGFSYLNIYGEPYTDSTARRFYAVARPAVDLAHLNTRDYSATIPQFDQAGSTNVKFTLTVATGDHDIPLEIRFPDGVTWTAKVNGEAVKYVRNGDVVSFEASHPTITQHSFAFTIGRSTGLFELQPDTLPDAFHFESKSGVEEGEVYSTEEITITGINTKVPVSVSVNGQPATDNVQIFIDGVEAKEPFLIANNGKLRLEVLHEGDTSRVSVTVGSGHTEFGLYTVPEPILNSIRNWAYQKPGVEIVSDAITNPGPQRVVLTLTDDTSALFSNGDKTVTLSAGGSVAIKFTPEEHRQYHVVFNTEQNTYQWQVWTDDHWLDPQPATQRAERYVLGDSGDIHFDAIPDNFYTNIRVPAGILLQINGKYVDLPLDVRGVYKEQTQVLALKTSDTVLRMEGLPSHDQPHTIMLGDAPLEWLYDFTEDPDYVVGRDGIAMFSSQVVAVTAEAVNKLTGKYRAEQAETSAGIDQQYDGSQIAAVSTTFDQQYRAEPDRSAPSVFVRDFATALDNTASAWYNPFVARTDNTDAQWSNRFVYREDAVTSDLFANSFVGVEPEHAVTAELYDFTSATDLLQTTFDTAGPRHVFWNKAASAPVSVVQYRTESIAGKIDNAKRARYLTDSVAGKIDNGSRVNWLNIAAAYQVPNDTRVRHVKNEVNWVSGGLPSVVQTPAAIDVAAALPQQSVAASLYHVGMLDPVWQPATTVYHHDNHVARWTHTPRITFRYDMYVGIVSKPKTYHVSTTSKAIGSTRSYKLDYTPQHVFDVVHRQEKAEAQYAVPAKTMYQAVSEAEYAPPAVVYQQQVSTGQHQEILVRAHITMHGRQIPQATLPQADAATGRQVQAPRVIEVEPQQAQRVSNNVIAVVQPRAQRVVVKTIAVPKPVLEVPDMRIDYGEQDPVKQGYFATELDALKNATEVWGHDPTAVYGIKQPNGYWTWAQVVVCENVCGSYGCDTRGYLSGG